MPTLYNKNGACKLSNIHIRNFLAQCKKDWKMGKTHQRITSGDVIVSFHRWTSSTTFDICTNDGNASFEVYHDTPEDIDSLPLFDRNEIAQHKAIINVVSFVGNEPMAISNEGHDLDKFFEDLSKRKGFEDYAFEWSLIQSEILSKENLKETSHYQIDNLYKILILVDVVKM